MTAFVRLVAVMFAGVVVLAGALASPGAAHAASADTVRADAEAYIAKWMQAFDCPGLAIGIVEGDNLAYAKGFGVRRKGGAAVDTRTVFQIGSATKAFLATSMAIMVDRGRFKWDDRVVDLDTDFQLKDPWVTREFRMFDLLAQRSGLPHYVNDSLGLLGLDRTALIRSLRHVEPTSSFRATFTYTNVTHILASRMVAQTAGAADWNAVLQAELFDPLGMKELSYSAAAIEAAPNHADGHIWLQKDSTLVPFTQVFPYDFDGAGNINSTIEDAARWLRLQLGNGTFEGRRLVTPENVAVTRTPRVGMSDKVSYAMGWVIQQTPNGTIIWHNGGTASFGSNFAFAPDRGVAVVVLSNQNNVGLPDAVSRWVMDRLLGNPDTDHAANAFKAANDAFDRQSRQFAKPADARPALPIAPLAGRYSNPGFGEATLAIEGDAAVLTLKASDAKLRLDGWDGSIFTATLVPVGRFAAVAEDLGPGPMAFAQFQMDSTGRLNTLRLTFEEGQAYDFTRE